MASDENGPKLVRGVTRPDPDDGDRGALGVIVSLVRRSDGTIRLVLDDARRQAGGSWEPRGLFTSRDYPAAPLLGLEVDPSELESIGLSVVSRLVALGQVFGEGD